MSINKDKPNKLGLTSPENPGRRKLFAQVGLASGAATLVMTGVSRHALASDPLPIPQWTKQLGSPVGTHPYGQPSPFEKSVLRLQSNPATSSPGYVPPMPQSSWTLTPLQDLQGSITPNGLFFERHHAGIPAIDPGKHRLVIHGMVKRNLLLDMEQLKRFPSVSKMHFLECSGNSDLIWHKPYGKTAQDIHGLVSCALWTGVRLSTLLREAGVDTDKARWVIAEGADGSSMARSIPMARALDDCIIVYAQNGEALRPEQGYPIRLVVPGCEGNLNVKWVRRLEITDTPQFAKDETAKYSDLVKGGKARISTLVMEAKSLITFPSGGHTLPESGFYEIRGIAWSGRGKITGVDVSTDGGKNWQPAVLSGPVLSKCMTEFTFAWHWNKKATVIMSRATDDTGYTQPFIEQIVDARGPYSAYHNNGIQRWSINTIGEVDNA